MISRRRGQVLALSILLAVVSIWLFHQKESHEVIKVKSGIAGVRHIHKMIKTRTGQEEIGYPEGYLSEAISHVQRNLKQQARTTNDIPWVERGPGNVGGRTRNVLVDAADPTGATWLIGTAGGGIWRTTDEGDTWANVSPTIPNLSVVTLAQSTSNPSIIYAGTGEGALGGNFVNGLGILKSLDGGLNWSLLTSTTGINAGDFLNTNRIIVHPENANLLYAGTSNGVRQEFASGIFKSEDGGLSWTKILDANARVQQLAFDPEDSNTIYASLILRGILKSTDGGNTWTTTPLATIVAASGGSTERTEFAISPSNPSKIYASVSYVARSGSGLYWSTDKAETWKEIRDEDEDGTDFLIQGEYDNAIVVNPENENRVYWGGVNLWTVLVDPAAVGQSTRDFVGVDEEGTTPFLSFVTFNNGTHFNNSFLIANSRNTPNIEIRFGGLSQKAHRFFVPEGATSGVPAIEYEYQDYIDVPFEVWDTDANQQLMVSFRDQSRDGAFNLNPRELDAEESMNREYLFLHNRPYDAENPDPEITVNGGQEVDQLIFIWPTLTDGATWNSENLPESILRIKFAEIEFQEGNINLLGGNNSVHVDHHHLTYAGNRLITANDGGVAFSTNNGLSFTEKELGLVTSQYYGADKKPGEPIYIGGTQDNDVNLSGANPDAASIWEDNAFPQFFADGFEVAWNRDGQRILATNQHNFIFRSDDAGATWEESTTGISDSDLFGEDADTPFFTKVAYSKLGDDRAYAVSDNGVWYTENFGVRWRISAIPNQFGGFLDVEVSDVDVNVVWAGGAMDTNRKLHVSEDGGVTFRPVNVYDAFPEKGNISTIVPDPNDRETAYVLFSQVGEPKIIKTTDMGETWSDISGFVDGTSTAGFPDVGTFSLLVFPDPDRIWAGTEIGVFESLDGGASWAILPNDFPAVAVWDMKVVDGEIVVGTHGRGIWSADLELEYPNQELQLVLDADISVAADARIYPNPSHGDFQVINDGASIDRIEIWSLEGKLIKSFKEAQSSYSLNKKGLFVSRIYKNGEVITSKLLIK